LLRFRNAINYQVAESLVMQAGGREVDNVALNFSSELADAVLDVSKKIYSQFPDCGLKQ
jgi:hypothetical protein